MISILMPMYNAAPFLAECLDSIIAQSYKNWELIIVDDFSIDSSRDIVLTYQSKDKRIILLKNDVKGIQPALRLAFKHASGQLITRMDSDDLMTPNKLLWMIDAWKKAGKGSIVTGNVSYFSMTNLGNGYQSYADWLNQLGNDRFSEIYKECVIPSSCWLIHRDDLIQCGSFESDIYPEDYHLCFQFYKNTFKVIHLSKTLHKWRDHSDRTSRNDPRYADNSFLELKIHFFLQIDYQVNHPLILWGAGKKGKRIAHLLHKNDIPFEWISNNPKKIGQMIHHSIIKNTNQISFDNAVILVGFYCEKDDRLMVNRLSATAKNIFFFN